MAQTVNKIQAIIYRIQPGKQKKVKFLLFKRPASQGDYWQFITGNIKQNETEIEAVSRELIEETGILKVENIIDTNIAFTFQNQRGMIKSEKIFLVLLTKTPEIIISDEHEDFRWLDYDQALNLLSWENNKKTLALSYEIILKRNLKN